ncbi:MAG: TolC family protein [Bacteroidaceae bacterium]|nr:TolC family protein [Bacteroidaceae bacterium]
MKFLLKPVLALAMLAMMATSAKAQDTLRISLKEAVQIALSENPTIKVADQEIQLKKEANREVIYGLLPEVSLVGSFNHTIEKQTMAMMGQTFKVGSLNSVSGGVSASLPVFVPALYQSMKLTKKDVELAMEKARSSRLDMVNQVTKAFYQLLLAQDSYKVLQKSYKQSEDNFNIVDAKYQQGSVSEYDKISAEVQMRSLKPSVVSAGNGVNLAMLQLKVLLGMESNMPVAVVGNLKDYEMAMFTRQAQPQPENIVGGNTTLRQLDMNYDMLKRNLKLKYTNFMPSLALSFQYMYTTLGNDWKISNYQWNPYSTLGLSLSIPLFKGSNFSQVKQAKLQLKQLDQTRINTERQLKMQAQSYLDNMSASSEQVVSNKEAVYQAEKGRTIAEKRYEVGRGTILELNSSEVALTQAQLTYNQSIYDYLVAKADLDLVMGVEDMIIIEEENK